MSRFALARSCGTLLLALLLFSVGGQGRAAVTSADQGRLIGQIERPFGCFGGNGGVGVAMRFTEIFYTCQASSGLSQSTQLYVTNLDGVPLRQFPVRDANDHLIPVHAIAWDSSEDVLWGVDQFPTGPSPLDASGAVWRIDVRQLTGGLGNEAYLATLAFTFNDAKLCNLSLKDSFITGLAVDDTTDTVYVSGQGGSLIRAFTKTGTPAPNDPIDFGRLTKNYCPGGCRTSGLAFGTDGRLMASARLDARLFVIDPSGPTLQDVFTSGSPRNWDLECGPIVFDAAGAPSRTVLSADLFSNLIRIVEAPSHFCNPVDVVMRNYQVSPNPITLPPTRIGIVRVSFEAAAFGGTPAQPLLTAATSWSARLDRFHPIVRLLAEPGDTCSLDIEDFLGPIHQLVTCAEGDTAGSPSVHGFAVCYDGVDNDGDGLTDFQDPDCTGQISHLDASVALGETFQTISRYAVVGGCDGGRGLTIGAAMFHPLDTNTANNGGARLVNFVPSTC